MTIVEHVSEHLTLYPLVPLEAAQGWKLELFELAEPILPHYHKIQRQIILVADGMLNASYGSKEVVALRSGELTSVDPGVVHSLSPEGMTRFFAIDIPGFMFPEDVYHDIPAGMHIWSSPDVEYLPPLDSKYFGYRIVAENYSAYELTNGKAFGNKWSAALLEIHDSPRHFHRIEKEIFIVVNGILDIEIEGSHQILTPGESIVLYPNSIHHLKSAKKHPVRVLCFSFPAFDPADMHCID